MRPTMPATYPLTHSHCRKKSSVRALTRLLRVVSYFSECGGVCCHIPGDPFDWSQVRHYTLSIVSNPIRHHATAPSVRALL